MTGKRVRGVLLDEFVAVIGWSREHAIKALRGGGPQDLPTCDGQPCGKRMKDTLPLWTDHLSCPDEVHSKLSLFRAAGIARLEPRNGLLTEWSLFKNLFCVTMKQESKGREGAVWSGSNRRRIPLKCGPGAERPARFQR